MTAGYLNVIYDTHIRVLTWSVTTISAAGTKTLLKASRIAFCSILTGGTNGDYLVSAAASGTPYDLEFNITNVVGTSITVNTFSAALFGAAGVETKHDLAKITSTKFACIHADSTGSMQMNIISVSGTTCSAGNNASAALNTGTGVFTADLGAGGVLGWTDDDGDSFVCGASRLATAAFTSAASWVWKYDTGTSNGIALTDYSSSTSVVVHSRMPRFLGTGTSDISFKLVQIAPRMALYSTNASSGEAILVLIYLGNNGRMIVAQCPISFGDTNDTMSRISGAANDDYSKVLVTYASGATVTVRALKK